MSSIFGVIGVETPKYTVLKTLSGLQGAEVRQYEKQIRAEVRYEVPAEAPIMESLNNPFRSLAGFIFGGNKARSHEGNEKVSMTAPVVMHGEAKPEKIAMTAPVVLTGEAAATPSSAEGAKAGTTTRVMAFIMPSKYSSVEELPLPKDARVALVEVPPRAYAALTFRGAMGAAVQKQKEAALREAAAKEGVKVSPDPAAVHYNAFNPPWTLPWLKTNEVLIPVLE